jgi:hypothetical protein
MFPQQENSKSLRRKLEEALAAYQLATNEYRRLTAISTDTFETNPLALSDGIVALKQAINIHQKALLNYQSALRAFTDSLGVQKVHLKLHHGRRLALCGVWPGESFLVVAESAEAPENVCQVCLKAVRTKRQLED